MAAGHADDKYQKYKQYDIATDPLQNDRATEIKLLSCARPHMRGFHFSWFSFFLAFTAWFALAPMMPAVVQSIQTDTDTTLMCLDKVCNPKEFFDNGTWSHFDSCKPSGELSDTRLVVAGGHNPGKGTVPTGNYTKGKDKKHDKTGESCKTIKLRKKKGVWTANILSVVTTIVVRLVVGPLNDLFGPRTMQSSLLLIGAVPTYCAMTIHSFTDLAIIRACIGMVGATFVMCQYWSSIMFAREIVGTANGTVGGWGNLGGGFTQAFMIGMFSMMKAAGHDDDKAWRLAMLVPATALVCVSAAMFFLTDDCPKGNYGKLIKVQESGREGGMQKVSAASSAKRGFSNPVAWILSLQYGACFGVELHLNNSLAMYLWEGNDEPSGPNVLTMEMAGVTATLFGLMNLFARSTGGILSDKLNDKFGMRGRLMAQTACLIAEGVVIIVWSRLNSLPAAICVLIVFSTFVQATEGSTYSIVPYVDPHATGTIAGLVGAGGNMGAMCWGMMFLFGEQNMSDGYMYLGFIVLGCVPLTALISIPGHRSLFCGEDDPDARVKAPWEEAAAAIQNQATNIEKKDVGEMGTENPEAPAAERPVAPTEPAHAP